MTGLKRKSILIVAASILVTILTLVAVAALTNSKDDKSAPTTVPTVTEATPETTDEASTTEKTDPTSEATAEETVVDPANLKYIDIEPLHITVAYTQGIPGFEFAVKRTADQTQYVEFTAPELIGTKCTDDEGLIATIIKNPSSSEDQTTVDKAVTVGNDTYGIALTSNSCTKNVELLAEYQKAFLEGLPSLEALEES